MRILERFTRKPERTPVPEGVDYLVAAKHLAQASATKPLDWAEAHELLRTARRAGMLMERERMQKALDEGQEP